MQQQLKNSSGDKADQNDFKIAISDSVEMKEESIVF